jgi:predicted O-linked N-acetylglucosamine transferase (SPINDLY family)
MNRQQRRSEGGQGGYSSDQPAGSGGASTDLFNAALRYHRSGKLAEAQLLYGQVLSINPAHVPSHHNLGNIFRQAGRASEAVSCYQRALTLAPNLLETHNNLANTLQDLGRLDEAIRHYQKALALDPDNAEIHNNLGTALQDQGRSEAAAVSYQRALALDPGCVDALANLGNAYRDLGQLDQAVAHYRRGLGLDPNHVGIHNCLGVALRELGALDEAVTYYERALALDPSNPGTYCNLGVALRDQGHLDQAEAQFLRALEFEPYYAEARNNLGLASYDQGRPGNAVTHFEQALAIKPDYPEAENNLGIAFQDQGRLDDAITHFERALKLRPDFVPALYNSAVLLYRQGRVDEATLRHRQALAVNPTHADAKFGLCMAQLPIIYQNMDEITERRAAYKEHLREICRDLGHPKVAAHLAKGVGSNQPFYLAYQGRNDRDLQALYGSAVCKIMAERFPGVALPPPPGPGEPVRVGIVSEYFRDHTVWKLLIKGWVSQLDRRRFRVFGYHTGRQRDATTKAAASLCDHFAEGPLPADRWREAILADAPHILIYPEVGMGPMAAWLAAQRLAPTQCNSWGHPETSGFPTLDYFLSSELMEPPDGQHHYTEKLVRLPNLSIYYEPIGLQPLGTGLAHREWQSSGRLVYWCGQSLYKYLPQYDEVFPRIAREVGNCRFIFIEFADGGYVTELFRKRLDRAFAGFGLRASDYVVVLPRMSQDQFVAATGQSDIGLDSIGWSGGNTTLESLVHDLPIVTMTGALMRGRHTTAMLQMMRVTDTISETVDDYVSIAVRLAHDVSWRMALRKRIGQNKHRLYRDDSCILGLGEFLVRVAHRG